MPKFTEISPSQLMRLIGLPDAPALIDVCIDDDFLEDPRLIPGAVRISHKAILEHVEGLKKNRVVVICQKGKKLSHGVAALLRTRDIHAEVLEGGNHAWRDAGFPLIPTSSIPNFGEGATRWVTRARPKIDRIACPWLIRRFVDARAEFLFVPAATVLDVAEKFDAVPFDIEGVEWSHHGANCTFDKMIQAFDLTTPALAKLADVVRAADTDKLDQSPQAAGLLALSVGLSRQYTDDAQQLDAGMAIYDALYRWARDGQNESHAWPEGTTSR